MLLVRGVLLAVALGLPIAALAQAYPSKPVRMVVANPAGGPADGMARVLAQRLGSRLGEAVIVDNRPGADGVIGSTAVARAEPDGYTLYFTSSSHAVNASLYRASIPFNTVEDFEPVVLIGDQPLAIAVPASLPVKDLREFIALAKAKPGALNYGATASVTYLATALFTSMAGIEMTRVPYKGAAPAMTALMAGDIQLVLSGVGPVMPHVKSGRLKVLAVTGSARSALAPEIPTASEAGVPGYVAAPWYAVLAPARTPRAIVERLNREFRALLEDPGVREQLAPQGMTLTPSSPDELGRFIREEVAKWGKVVQDTGIKVE
jgi:tripartite-type tricarboxylate transporter receptor subunit TctC